MFIVKGKSKPLHSWELGWGRPVHIGKKGRMDSSVTMKKSSLEELPLHGMPLPSPDLALNAK